jgi:hypothetical protein
MTSCTSINPENPDSDKFDGALSSMKSKTESGGVSITQAKSSSRGHADTVKSNAGDSRNDANKNTVVSEGNTNNVGRQPVDQGSKDTTRDD